MKFQFIQTNVQNLNETIFFAAYVAAVKKIVERIAFHALQHWRGSMKWDFVENSLVYFIHLQYKHRKSKARVPNIILYEVRSNVCVLFNILMQQITNEIRLFVCMFGNNDFFLLFLFIIRSFFFKFSNLVVYYICVYTNIRYT